MLTHPTIDHLRALKLDGMADAFVDLQAQDRAKDLDHAEWLALLLDREAANRNTKRFQSRMRSAKLRHGQASIEDVDYRTSRRLDKALFQQLAAGRWMALWGFHARCFRLGRRGTVGEGELQMQPVETSRLRQDRAQRNYSNDPSATA